jgi:hypothetical protein
MDELKWYFVFLMFLILCGTAYGITALIVTGESGF